MTIRELAREQTKLTRAIEKLAESMNEGFREMRRDMVRRDLHERDIESLRNGDIANLRSDVEDLKDNARGNRTALVGMFLTIISGVLLVVLTQGLTL